MKFTVVDESLSSSKTNVLFQRISAYFNITSTEWEIYTKLMSLLPSSCRVICCHLTYNALQQQNFMSCIPSMVRVSIIYKPVGKTLTVTRWAIIHLHLWVSVHLTEISVAFNFLMHLDTGRNRKDDLYLTFLCSMKCTAKNVTNMMITDVVDIKFLLVWLCFVWVVLWVK